MAITCFMSQTFLDSELLIVDDGTENVEDIIPVSSRIRYIRFEQKIPIGTKRNICCEQAQGSIIIHWDDDDWSAANRIEYQVSKLESSEKQLLIFYNVLYWNETTNLAYRYHPQPIGWGAAPGSSFCYQKAWWRQHPFEERIKGEDSYFAKEAQERGQLIASDAEKLIVFREHENSTSHIGCLLGNENIPEVNQNEIPSEFFI
jgi:glycosyltransferase involved in cell wall biosynthesis